MDSRLDVPKPFITAALMCWDSCVVEAGVGESTYPYFPHCSPLLREQKGKKEQERTRGFWLEGGEPLKTPAVRTGTEGRRVYRHLVSCLGTALCCADGRSLL